MFSFDIFISEFIFLLMYVVLNVVKIMGGDYLLIWYLEGLLFVGCEEWELEYWYNMFNCLLQMLRVLDFVNVVFWVYDICCCCMLKGKSYYKQCFNQDVFDQYMGMLFLQCIMQNELYFIMIYCLVVVGKCFVEKLVNVECLQVEQEQVIEKLMELVGNVEVVICDYVLYCLGMYEVKNGVVFLEMLELFGYLINCIDELVLVLLVLIKDYLLVSWYMFLVKIGDFVINIFNGVNYFGVILNIKEYVEGIYLGIFNGLKYLDYEYVIIYLFSLMGCQDVFKVFDCIKGMMIFLGDKVVSQIVELDQVMDQLLLGNFVLGEYYFIMVVYGDSQVKLLQNVVMMCVELFNVGFVLIKEDLVVILFFYLQLLVNWCYCICLVNVSLLNFLGLLLLYNFVIGKQYNNFWGDCVIML